MKFRLSISPPPTDEESAAIYLALEKLFSLSSVRQHVGSASLRYRDLALHEVPCKLNWKAISRLESLRDV